MLQLRPFAMLSCQRGVCTLIFAFFLAVADDTLRQLEWYDRNLMLAPAIQLLLCRGLLNLSRVVSAESVGAITGSGIGTGGARDAY